MPKDWIQIYLSAKAERLRSEMRTSDFAVAGAPGLFKALSFQVEADVEAYEAATHSGLKYDPTPPLEFTVRSPSNKLPYARLDVELSGLTIECTLKSKRDDTCNVEESTSRYRIAADVSGNVQIMKNGASFEEAYELSEEILRRLFDRLP